MQCRDCCGRGKVVDRSKRTAIFSPVVAWTKCVPCKGSGEVSAPTLFRWPDKPKRIGPPDVCDQCNKPGVLWSFQLADDEPVLCQECLKALQGAIGVALAG